MKHYSSTGSDLHSWGWRFARNSDVFATAIAIMIGLGLAGLRIEESF
jgi:hypothetical protein